MWHGFKGTVHRKMNILPLFTHPLVGPNLTFSSPEHKRTYFDECLLICSYNDDNCFSSTSLNQHVMKSKIAQNLKTDHCMKKQCHNWFNKCLNNNNNIADGYSS